AQAKLDMLLKPVSQSLQTEVARVSLIADALKVVEDLAVTKEMADLLEARAQIQAQALDRAAKTVAIRNNGEFPKKLQEVERYLADKSNLRDPWGRDWQYDPAGNKSGRKTVDIWTVSP